MANETANYRLITDVVSDDIVEPEHNNRLADTLDRVLGSFLGRMVTAGVHDGWLITAEKQVSAGEGLIAACWCSTAAAQDIVDLADDAVNYVFAESTESSGADGSVSFRAQLSPAGPDASVLLGTIELDASGEVVAVDNEVEGAGRECYALAWRTLSGSGIEEAVPAGGEVEVVVEHDALRIPGAIEFAAEGEDFTWEIDRTHEAASFRVAATNNGAEAADFVYTWERQGIAP